MIRSLPFFLLLLLAPFLTKADGGEYPENPYQDAFDSAYAEHPSIPKGMLEAVAYKMSRFRHLSDDLPASCTGMPRSLGVMGLVKNGQGVFRENLQRVAQWSSYSEQGIIDDPSTHILAYAEAYDFVSDTLGIAGQALEEQVPIFIVLSELPRDSSAAQNFALSARLYDIFQQLDDRDFQNAYGLPSYQVPFDSIFGPHDHEVLNSEFIRIGANGVMNGQGQAFQQGVQRSPDYPPAIWDPAPSCNYSSRNGTPVSHVAIHTMQGSYAGAIAWAKDCNSNVSFHYAIRSSDGQITQLVLEDDMAWHIGSENDYTIGIEHEGYITDPSYLTSALYQSSADLCRHICNNGGYGISPLRTHDGPACSGSTSSCLLGACIRIKGHQHYPNQTHTDPGPYYDWERYYRLINPDPPSTLHNTQSGTFYDSGGPTGDYSNDKRHVHTIAPPNAAQVELTVNDFHLEAGYDSLYIYDGGGIDATRIGEYSGTSIPSNIFSSSDSLSIEFRSDCQTTKSGWSFSWNTIIDDSIPPSSSIAPLTDWKTQDFSVSFTDQDSGGSGLSKSFYQASHFNGSEWRANHRNGFFLDRFDQGSIHPDWSQVSGNWSVMNGRLVQTDETVGNSNIHAPLDQEHSDRYLYHWKGLIEGSGSNKRAGLHIFCSEPDSSQRGDSYFVWFRQDDQAIQLYKVTNNSWGSGPVTQTAYPFQASTWYDLKLSYDRISGAFDVYVDDSLCLEWKDPNPIDSGRAISFRNGHSIHRVDSLRVYRSRSSNLSAKVGPDSTQDLRYQNPSPSGSAGAIRSLAQDSAGNLSPIDREKVDVDWTAPQLPAIRDGIGSDADTLLASDTLKADWDQALDPHSGIMNYAYAVDSLAGDSGILGWTSSTDSSMAFELNAPQSGTTYYTSLRVWNQAGLMAGDTTSDGILYLLPSGLKEAGPIGRAKLYPSPLKEGNALKLRLHAQRPFQLRAAIYDGQGRHILRKELELARGRNLKRFDLGLASGAYYLRISGNGFKPRTLRFIVR